MFVTVLFIITPNQKHSDAHQLELDKQTVAYPYNRFHLSIKRARLWTHATD